MKWKMGHLLSLDASNGNGDIVSFYVSYRYYTFGVVLYSTWTKFLKSQLMNGYKILVKSHSSNNAHFNFTAESSMKINTWDLLLRINRLILRLIVVMASVYYCVHYWQRKQGSERKFRLRLERILSELYNPRRLFCRLVVVLIACIWMGSFPRDFPLVA